MNELLLLIKVRIKLLKELLSKLDSANLLRIIGYSAVAFLFSFGGYGFFYAIFRFLRTSTDLEGIGEPLTIKTLSIGFITFFSMLVVSNIITAIPTMYRSAEITYLLTTPLSYKTIFITKFLENLFYSSWAILLLGIPIVLSYGMAWHAPWYFYILIILLFIPFIFLSASIGITIIVLIMRYVIHLPRKILLAIIAIIVISIVAYSVVILVPKGIILKETTDMNVINQYLSDLQVSSPYIPSTWIQKSLYSAVHNDISSSLFYWLVLLSNTLVGVMICYWVGNKIFYSSWTKSLESEGLFKRNKSNGKVKLNFLSYIFPSQMRILVDKDIKLFVRDPIQWTQVLILFVLLIVYLLNIRNVPRGTNIDKAFWATIVAYANFAFTGYVLATLAVRFVFPTISMEGPAFWSIGTAPIKLSTIFWEKFLLSFLFSVLCAEILTTISGLLLKLDSFVMILSWFCILLMSISLTSLAIGMGAIYPNFKEKNPSRIASTGGGMITIVLALVYVGLMVVILAMPLRNYFNSKLGREIFSEKLLVFSLCLIFLLNLFVSIVPIVVGMKVLKRYDF